jgi:hypothetical protein
VKTYWLLAALLFVSPSLAANEPSPAGVLLTCDFRRLVLFGANSDYPNGPAYYGVIRDDDGAPKTKEEFSDPETDLQNGADSFVASAQGAQFTLDTKTGRITPILFGPEKLRAIDELPGKYNYAQILSPPYGADPNATYSVGYFDIRLKFVSAIIMIDAKASGGRRVFKYISDGDTEFGYCREN